MTLFENFGSYIRKEHRPTHCLNIYFKLIISSASIMQTSIILLLLGALNRPVYSLVAPPPNDLTVTLGYSDYVDGLKPNEDPNLLVRDEERV